MEWRVKNVDLLEYVRYLRMICLKQIYIIATEIPSRNSNFLEFREARQMYGQEENSRKCILLPEELCSKMRYLNMLKTTNLKG